MPSIPCPSCGYDLAGLPEAAPCPECGLEDPPNALRRVLTTLKPHARNAAIASLILSLAYAALPLVHHLAPLVQFSSLIVYAFLSVPVFAAFLYSWCKLFARLGSPVHTLFRGNYIAILVLFTIPFLYIARIILYAQHGSPPLIPTQSQYQPPHSLRDLLIVELAVFLAFLALASLRTESLARANGGSFTTLTFAIPVFPAILATFCLCVFSLAPSAVIATTASLATMLYIHLNAAHQPPRSPTPPPHPETPPPPDRRSPDPPSAPRA